MDQYEFIKAFNDHHQSIFRFVYFRLYRNKQVAEDISQDVFVKAWEKRDLYDAAQSSIKNWLFIIARNLIVDQYRKLKSDVNIDYVENELVFFDENEDAIFYIEVIRYMKKLNENERELIVLRYIEDFEINEIAEITGKKYDATKVAINRAIIKLRELVNAE